MATGSFAINNVEIETPTTHKWVERSNLGTSGEGHNVYAAIRQYELRWSLMTPEKYNQIQVFYNAVGTTGTVVVSLPEYGANPYEFKNYSGCVLSEPYFGNYFVEHYQEVVLLVNRIRV